MSALRRGGWLAKRDNSRQTTMETDKLTTHPQTTNPEASRQGDPSLARQAPWIAGKCDGSRTPHCSPTAKAAGSPDLPCWGCQASVFALCNEMGFGGGGGGRTGRRGKLIVAWHMPALWPRRCADERDGLFSFSFSFSFPSAFRPPRSLTLVLLSSLLFFCFGGDSDGDSDNPGLVLGLGFWVELRNTAE